MSKRRDLLAGMFNPAPAHDEGPIESVEPALPSALGAMRSSLRELSSEADRARRLAEQIETGDRVVDIDPALVEPSFIRDRIPVEEDAQFAGFIESMRSGQQVPILVRPHPEDPGRFQAAYGHRRLRAAQHLGRPVRAIVKRLTDAELVVAQGKENAERRDLSFIERASFAALLEERGFERQTIQAALGVDKGDLSRLLAVARAVPSALILAIGPAPKAGRPRWLQLVEAMTSPGASKLVQKTIAGNEFRQADTNARFDLLMRALNAPRSERGAQVCKTADGKAIARVERGARSVRLAIADVEFGNFVAEAMARLHAEFVARAGDPQRDRGGAD